MENFTVHTNKKKKKNSGNNNWRQVYRRSFGTGQVRPPSVYTLRVDSCCVVDLMPSKLEEAFK